MKRIYVVVLMSVVIHGVVLSMEAYKPTVFLQNNYGYPIKYMVGLSADKILGNSARTESLGNVDDIPALFISATGYLDRAQLYGYYDLAEELKKIILKIGYPADGKDYDAIIMILPSGMLRGWDIAIAWESYDDDQAIDFFSVGSSLQEEELARVQIGQEYADKVKKICAVNYAKAEAAGMINLCRHVKNSFKSPAYKLHSKRNPKYQVPNIRPTVDEIKAVIDRCEKLFEKYRAKGFIS